MPNKISERPTLGPGSGKATVVAVDDQEDVLQVVQRSLRHYFEVVAFSDANAAIERIRNGGISVVVSDVRMPGMNGLELLRAVRRHDPDLPVVLLTGLPSLEDAEQAIEWGVFRYLRKPISPSRLCATVEQAGHLYRMAQIKREALALLGIAAEPSDRAGLEAAYRRALESLAVTFQPVFSQARREVLGYEACVRVAPPITLGTLLGMAERLGTELEVGRVMRSHVAALFKNAPDDRLLFMNVDPKELTDPELLVNDLPFSSLAERVVLEVSDGASLEDLGDLERRTATLRARGYRIAVSHVGAGAPGLTTFARLEPDFVKLDRSLTLGVHASPIKQKLVSSMARLCKDMSLSVVVEGVETPDERDRLVELGCDLLQGHLFAETRQPFPDANWD
jgi:EAL domain-containing protein (putative c-di-GMP-specific phosphodiesterase class I)/ActR/RegA family two-component response regulator